MTASATPPGEGLTLAQCPIGLFWCGDTLCLKIEYGNNEGRIDAYIVSSGEFFWGSQPQTIASQRATLVVSVDTDDAVRALTRAADKGGEVVGGWVCVPREMTEAMLDAYWHQTGESEAMRSRVHAYMRRYWPAMLAAAPSAPTPANLGDALAEARSQIINTPETADFMAGVPIEAAHQRKRWGLDHDAGKSPFDWFWLVGYLAQKAADAAVRGDAEKAMHHTISTAAALSNWHLALSGGDDRMRPGIAEPEPRYREGKPA